MRIAILGSFDFHLECIGFLLEIYDNNIVDIYLGEKTDKYNWIEYYLTIFKFNVVYDSFHKDIINNYDKIFKLSSNDYCLDDKKIISLLHLNQEPQRKCKSDKFISLSPYIQDNNINYVFPIYRPKVNNKTILSKNIIMIGHYTNNNFDNDTLNFITENINYNFIFIIYGSRSYSNLSNLKNVKILSNVKTNNMINLINDSKFILSKKKINYDRFSGQLSLAMSHEIPLIIDVKTQKDYNLSGITFNNNYSEIGNLDDITDEKYNFLKSEIKTLKDNLLDKNKKIFKTEF